MRWGPPHLSRCRSSGTKINSWNGVWIGHGCRMMVVLLFDYHPIDHLQPEPLAFYRAVVFYTLAGGRLFEAPLDSLARAVMASSLIARRMPNRPAFKLASSRKRVRPCLKGRQRGGHSPPYGLSPQPHSSHFPDGGRLQNFVTKVL